MKEAPHSLSENIDVICEINDNVKTAVNVDETF